MSSNHQQVLQRELLHRQKKNPLYSLRAFARSLKISPTILSQILSGKRQITPRVALMIADLLPLSDSERQEFIRSSLKKGNNQEKGLNGPLKRLDAESSIESESDVIALTFHSERMEEVRKLTFNYLEHLNSLANEMESSGDYKISVQIVPLSFVATRKES